jgi:hypothetical protein
MVRDLRSAGIPEWTEGRECESLTAALEYASDKASDMDMPVQVTCMGQEYTVYPPGLKNLGY